jgi:molybdenum cofactor cytidylyltransferase
MGELKQLLPLRGRPMVSWVVEAICQAGLAQVIVVLGAQAGAVSEALAGLEVDTVLNEDWEEGMASSLRVGMQLVRPGLGAVIIVLADQPSLGPDLIRGLAERWQSTGAPVVAPFYQGRRGNPVLFDCSLFADLTAVTGDKGGREIIQEHRIRMERVEVQDPAVLFDVDTRQDYERARASERRGTEDGVVGGPETEDVR